MITGLNIKTDHPLLPEIDYTLKVLSRNKRIELKNSNNGKSIGTSENDFIRISEKFITNYTKGKHTHDGNVGNSGFIELADGTPDYLSTAFYMLACLQEYDAKAEYDSLGRFKYSGSYQYRLSSAHQNLVQLCFDKLAEKLQIVSADQPTRYFLSHDIDTVYGAVLEDGFYAFKRGRFDVMLKLLFHVAINKPDWLNIDKIMRLESAYDCKSMFFWIARKGAAGGLKNADYNFKSLRFQKIFREVTNGFENGIHKSVSADTFSNELQDFNPKPAANRYHYLKFNLPSGYDALEESGIKLDASLGFAETMGFRNSYGQPTNPFKVSKRRPYRFVEVPLHVMDRTFFQYERISPLQAQKQILKFFDDNRKNCVLSVLWHNNFFTNYKFKGYLELYKSILLYIKENNLSTITQDEILNNYSIA